MEQSTSRVIVYFVTFFILFVGAVYVQSGLLSLAPHSSLTHSLVQSIATVIALFVGAAALHHYYAATEKNSMMLFIGVAFLATAMVDGYHTLVTSIWFIQTFPNVPPSVARWSWVATRIFLSVLLFVSLFNIFTDDKNRKRNEIIIYTVISLLTIGTVLFFSLVHLGFPTYPERFFARPEELIPGVIFIFVLIGYFIRGKWKTDTQEHWIVMCLIASVMCQIAYMSESKSVFDVMYISAHYVKILSYAMIYMGITAVAKD